MTREEAIKILKDLADVDNSKPVPNKLFNEAFDMAIEALSAEDVVPYEDYRKLLYSRYPDELVRCKDCRWWNSETNGCKRNPSVEAWYETDFCKYGERKEP